MIDPSKPNFGGPPSAPWRSRLHYAPQDPEAVPAISIVTALRGSGSGLLDTVECVRNQSLQQWEWIIVTDGPSETGPDRVLGELRGDRRIRILEGGAHSRGAALNVAIAEARADLVCQLDAEQLLEPTSLEKGLWYLTSHPEHSFVNSWSVVYGDRRRLCEDGFDQGERFLERNCVCGSTIVRRRALEAVGGYEKSAPVQLEAWDLWLRLADRGMWGGTIHEHLDWFRSPPPPPDEDPSPSDVLRSRHPRLFDGGFPGAPTSFPRLAQRGSEQIPCVNRLVRQRHRLLLVAPSLGLDAEGSLYGQAFGLLARRGWRFSVATASEGDGEWMEAMAKHTPDVHVLERFLRPEDHPRFLRYLVESRRPDVVLVDHGEFGRALGAYLRARCPEPTYVGFCHRDPNERSERALGSTLEGTALWDRVLVSGPGLRDRLGASERERADVVVPGVDANVWKPRAAPRGWLREQWGAEPEDVVVLFVGRLSTGVRLDVLARTFLELTRRKLPVRGIVVGDGEAGGWLAEYLRRHGLQESVRLLGRQPESLLLKTMAAADLFFLPGADGSAVRLLHAMAAGLVVVSADVGGQAELVTPECGVLVPCADVDSDVQAYADAVEGLLVPARRRELARHARARVLAGFGPDRMAEGLQVLDEVGGPARRGSVSSPRILLERAVEASRSLDRVACQLREREEFKRSLAEQARSIRELHSRGEARAETQAWLEDQNRYWKSTAEERARWIRDQESAIRELREVRSLLESESRSWMKTAEERDRSLVARDARIRELEEARSQLERELRDARSQTEERARCLDQSEERVGELQAALGTLERELEAVRSRLGELQRHTLGPGLRRRISALLRRGDTPPE